VRKLQSEGFSIYNIAPRNGYIFQRHLYVGLIETKMLLFTT